VREKTSASYSLQVACKSGSSRFLQLCGCRGGATATKTTPEQPCLFSTTTTTAISWVPWTQPPQQDPGPTWSNFFVNGWSTRPSLSTSASELSSLSVTSKALDPATPSFTVPLSFSCLSLTLLLFRFLSQRKVSYESLNGLGFLNQILIQFFFSDLS